MCRFPFFSLSVFNYIVSTKASDIIICENEVPDLEACEVISQLSYM